MTTRIEIPLVGKAILTLDRGESVEGVLEHLAEAAPSVPVVAIVELEYALSVSATRFTQLGLKVHEEFTAKLERRVNEFE